MTSNERPTTDDDERTPSDVQRAGLVALVGRPNVGKSTLLNQLIGQKVAIVSPKPQTTRTRILGILTQEDTQFVFIDTPGIHEARNLINKRMVDVAQSVLAEADVVVWVVDGSVDLDQGDIHIGTTLRDSKRPVIVAVNKIDRRSRSEVLPVLSRLADLLPDRELVPISALKGTNCPELLNVMTKELPFGPPLYDPDTLTDQTERTLAAEVVREQVLLQTEKEIPYAVAVTIDNFEEKGRLAVISATIHVERSSQKAILVGAKGQRIKAIGQGARLELEKMLDRKIYLELFVRVQEGWSGKAAFLRELGL